MTENDLATLTVNVCLEIHKELGPGLFEKVYEAVLADSLEHAGLNVRRQVAVPVSYKGQRIDEGFRADLIISEKVLVELKSIEALAAVHKKQVLTYLKLSGIRLGLLINSGGSLLKGNIHRLCNGLDP
jgi:GxxExxY protein